MFGPPTGAPRRRIAGAAYGSWAAALPTAKPR